MQYFIFEALSDFSKKNIHSFMLNAVDTINGEGGI